MHALTYNEVKPIGFLTNFIESLWEYEALETDYVHTIIPDGCFDLIAEFENGTLKAIKLTGVWINPIDVKIPKSTKILAIRFKLLAAEYLFQQELKSILNTAKDLPLTFWNIHLYQGQDLQKFASEIFNRIENLIKCSKAIDDKKRKLFELVYKRQSLSVKELSERVFWSSRQINRYFNQQFGFPLKTFLNVIRCYTSYNEISKGNLFPKANYFDQAHFIKEIKKHTNATPGELFKNENVRFLQLATQSKK